MKYPDASFLHHHLHTMSAVFSLEATNQLRAHKSKHTVGCEPLAEQFKNLQKDLTNLCREAIDSIDDPDAENSDLPIYDRDSVVSQLDAAATELALALGKVEQHKRAFDHVLLQVNTASDRFLKWQEENQEGTPDEEDPAPVKDENPNPNGNGHVNGKPKSTQSPMLPDIVQLYSSTLEAQPKPCKKSRASILKNSSPLRKHKQQLLWTLLPEVDLGDSDKWWLSIGSLCSKHVSGVEKLDPNPNGYGLSDSDSEDELFVSRKSNLKCPISGDYLQSPVRAITCKHLFSRDAFQEWLRNSGGRNKCPVAGCNQQFSKIGDVEPDEDVVWRVKRLKRNVERKQREKEVLGTQRI